MAVTLYHDNTINRQVK